ncbi:hypothetical protein DKX38_027297 [Salix brachista]|uniref:Uncharacterized protein n=1 Tax=Salix brachista TaxID=2182728 RepID=A0A5N5JBN1_9ROSI|nr:hypothetical protein DKX38_027297 [Salix brachista]
MAFTLHHYTLPFSSSLHQNTTLSLQSHQKPTRESQGFPIIHCSINQNNNITLRTCKNCKTQFDPSLNHPRACRFHTAHFGELLILPVTVNCETCIWAFFASKMRLLSRVGDMAKVQDLKGLYVLEGVKGKRFKQEIMIHNYNQGHNLNPSEGEYECLGETRRKFESVYTGGTMNTPDSGQVSQYWHCCGSEDPFDPGCTAGPHSSYDD